MGEAGVSWRRRRGRATPTLSATAAESYTAAILLLLWKAESTLQKVKLFKEKFTFVNKFHHSSNLLQLFRRRNGHRFDPKLRPNDLHTRQKCMALLPHMCSFTSGHMSVSSTSLYSLAAFSVFEAAVFSQQLAKLN